MIVLDNNDVLAGDASTAAVVDYVVSGFVGTTPTLLAQSQMSDSPATALYTSGADATIVSSIMMTNTHSSAVTVNLFVEARRIIPEDMTLGIGYSLYVDGQRITVLDASGNVLTVLSMALGNLSDVTLAGEADHDMLYYDNATSLWKNATPATILAQLSGQAGVAFSFNSQEITNAKLNALVLKGTFTRDGTVTLPAFTLGANVTLAGYAFDAGSGYLEIDTTGKVGLRMDGGIAAGVSPLNYIQHYFGGVFLSGGTGTVGVILQIDVTLTGAPGDTSFLVGTRLTSNITTQIAEENVGFIAQLALDEPVINDRLTGAGTIPIASTLHISGAPTEGDINAAIYVASGDTYLQTVTLNGALALQENAPITLDAALSVDGKYSGITEAGTAGAILAFGDLVYYAVADSRWELTDADAVATAFGKIGICVLAAADGAATTILLWGKVRADAVFPALTIGAPVHIGVTAGDIQVAAPTGTNKVVRIIGYGNTAEDLFFCPDNTYVELA